MSFVDDPTQNVWAGWEYGSSTSQDVNGVPNLLGGTIEADAQGIKSITIDYEINMWSSWLSKEWKYVNPEDIFINTDPTGNSGTDTWDYVIKFTDDVWSIYAIDLAVNYPLADYKTVNTTPYNITQNKTVKEYPGEGSPRKYHPFGVDLDKINGEQLLGTGTVADAWDTPTSADVNKTKFSFSLSFDGNNGVNLFENDSFILGFAVSCANDTLYVEVTPTPTPEPSTFALLGLGLAGLIAVGRKRLG